mmetsp:Transcript_21858/g.65146  ORF Transcript_21858/g.65146 Transcript_21858/m.65146 type:complete len:227 (+) Transcript_21858:836-1516(+)
MSEMSSVSGVLMMSLPISPRASRDHRSIWSSCPPVAALYTTVNSPRNSCTFIFTAVPSTDPRPSPLWPCRNVAVACAKIFPVRRSSCVLVMPSSNMPRTCRTSRTSTVPSPSRSNIDIVFSMSMSNSMMALYTSFTADVRKLMYLSDSMCTAQRFKKASMSILPALSTMFHSFRPLPHGSSGSTSSAITVFQTLSAMDREKPMSTTWAHSCGFRSITHTIMRSSSF